MSTDKIAPSESAARPMSLVLKILLAAVGIVALFVIGFVITVAMQPAEFRVERSTTIEAPPDVVFAHVNDFHKWEDWSPWAKLDPNSKAIYEGADAGEGAVFRWAGNDKVGEGSMSIAESLPPNAIKINLEFIKPMQDTAMVEFTFRPEGEQTVVTWSMHGENNFMEKAFCMFMDMDGMLGGDFEKGLASMKSVVETPPQS
jgi:uncharacterized protein YndB with AHSA1/START domain